MTRTISNLDAAPSEGSLVTRTYLCLNERRGRQIPQTSEQRAAQRAELLGAVSARQGEGVAQHTGEQHKGTREKKNTRKEKRRKMALLEYRVDRNLVL